VVRGGAGKTIHLDGAVGGRRDASVLAGCVTNQITTVSNSIQYERAPLGIATPRLMGDRGKKQDGPGPTQAHRNEPHSGVRRDQRTDVVFAVSSGAVPPVHVQGLVGHSAKRQRVSLHTAPKLGCGRTLVRGASMQDMYRKPSPSREKK